MTLKNGFKTGDSDCDEKIEYEIKKDEKVDVEEEENEEENESRAIDGGWGWMVTLGMIVVFVSLTVFRIKCFIFFFLTFSSFRLPQLDQTHRSLYFLETFWKGRDRSVPLPQF